MYRDNPPSHTAEIPLMQRTVLIFLKYTTLFVTLGACGTFLSHILDITGCPQYIRNVIHCSIIALFAMENLTLLSDLDKCKENDISKVTIKDLTQLCNALQKQNSLLKSELERFKETPKSEVIYSENISSLVNAWAFYCNTENVTPPPKLFLINPLEHSNHTTKETISPTNTGQLL